jgi:hypothetical protein
MNTKRREPRRSPSCAELSVAKKYREHRVRDAQSDPISEIPGFVGPELQIGDLRKPDWRCRKSAVPIPSPGVAHWLAIVVARIALLGGSSSLD